MLSFVHKTSTRVVDVCMCVCVDVYTEPDSFIRSFKKSLPSATVSKARGCIPVPRADVTPAVTERGVQADRRGPCPQRRAQGWAPGTAPEGGDHTALLNITTPLTEQLLLTLATVYKTVAQMFSGRLKNHWCCVCFIF